MKQLMSLNKCVSVNIHVGKIANGSNNGAHIQLLSVQRLVVIVMSLGHLKQIKI